ncbi:PspC domain-containing protein [Rathayibacter sp. AY1E2]|uniref:PspC domain-containing protein n=1 Tax=Rathayibacter sp. AY1E2 TaxID=2080550 RepID=UPI000CE84CE0|nr:PspC domain-containing protein [Rathayibacter sp. AY1E2]PPH52231.1 hypothetical protein C5C49_09085 [Rathayibacter sp. AY1E2]
MTGQSTTPPSSAEPDGTEAASTATTPIGTDPGAAGPDSAGPDSTGPESTGPEASGPADPPPAPENRFVLWLRGLDLPRRPGWIGGVCAGIADRLGIDPLIVRGIVLVVAVLGGPALLLYAAAWLLLPDQDGALPVERLLRGSLDRVHAGIGVLVLASMLPVAQGFWSLGGAYTGAMPWAPATGRTLWSLVVLGLMVAFVVWIVRRSRRSDDEAAHPAQASPSAHPSATLPYPATTAPAYPAPDPGLQDERPSSPEAVAEWRERQEAWRAEREAFRAQQSATARETARARAEEARLAAAAVTAARLERQRLRRAANPRLRASLTLLALGAAALTGALVSLTASGPTALVVGAASAALVLAVVIVLAGLFRRRAIALIALATVALVTAACAAVLPTDRELLPVLGTYGFSSAAPGRYATLAASDLRVTVAPGYETSGEPLDLWIGYGHVSVATMAGTAVRLEATTEDTELLVLDADGGAIDAPREVRTADGRQLWTQTFGDPEAEPFVVRIAQEGGSIRVQDSTPGADSGTTAPDADATPSPTPETGAAR